MKNEKKIVFTGVGLTAPWTADVLSNTVENEKRETEIGKLTKVVRAAEKDLPGATARTRPQKEKRRDDAAAEIDELKAMKPFQPAEEDPVKLLNRDSGGEVRLAAGHLQDQRATTGGHLALEGNGNAPDQVPRDVPAGVPTGGGWGCSCLVPRGEQNMPSYLSPGVYVEEVTSGSRPIEGVGTSVAAFVGLTPSGPLNEPTLVTNWSQYVASFGEFTDGYYLAHSVYGFFNNGGSAAYVVRVGGSADGAPLDGAAGPGRTAVNNSTAPAALESGEPRQLGAFTVTAIAPGVTGALSVEVTHPEDEGSADRFKLTVKDGDKAVETFDVTAKKGGRTYVVTQVKERSKLITVAEAAPTGQLVRPDAQTVALAAPAPTSAVAPAAQADESHPGPAHYLGDSADRTGFGGLEAVDEISMVAVPDLMAAYQRGAIDLEGVKAVQLGLITHCELMGDRVAVIDPPPGLNARQVRVWRQETAGYDSKYAALYYPWIKSFDPSSGQSVLVPPSGHVAGIWARNDAERGVHKAPANEVVRGAVDLETQITRGEQDLLNPIGVNCIRAFPGRGIRVWGARTVSSDPAWRYLNIRRYFNYLEESILLGTQWVVFEPNDHALWARIRRNISAFLVNEWRSGALFGQRPEEAFYVKCDEETNPPESVDVGRVVCEIGIAPVKPAEFVIFRLAQFSSGSGELEE